MKRVIVLFWLVILSGNTIVNASFTAYKMPDRQTIWHTLLYQKFESTVTVQGLFYETELHVRGKLGKEMGPYNSYIYPPPGNYEWKWTFNLSEKSYVTDVQIWDEEQNKYISAQVVDVSTAESIYSSDSTTTPKVLLREYRYRYYDEKIYQFYCLNIAPVKNDESVDLIIKYISPCHMKWDKRRFQIDVTQFYRCSGLTYNQHSPAEFKILDYDNPDYLPENLDGLSLTWEKQNNYWYAKIGPTNSSFSKLKGILATAKENKHGQFFQTYGDEEYKFYQLSSVPSISFEDRPARHIIVAVDMIEEPDVENYRNIYLNKLAEPLKIATTERDSIVFVTSDFGVRWLDTSFEMCTDALIQTRLNQIKEIVPRINSLPFILREAVDYLNSKNLPGEIWLISNDDQHGYPVETVMEIVDQTNNKALNNIVFRIIDTDRGSTGYFINNKLYRANEYLYENLSRLSKGSVATLRSIPDYDLCDIMIDCLAPKVSSVEIDPIPQVGLSFSRYDMNQGRKNFNITSRYFQIGMYDGNVPFLLNYFGNYENRLYHKKFQLLENPAEISDYLKKFVKNYWFGHYIRNNLLEQPQSYDIIKYIEELSAENNILSPYSGFVIPGPGGYVGFKRLVAEDSVIVTPDESTENENKIPKKCHISTYPNPFNSGTTIYLSIPDVEITENSELKIVNLLGQEVQSKRINISKGTTSFTYHWDGRDQNGNNVVSGIYFVIYDSEDTILHRHKITLLR